jgi:hypothetical protein
MPVGKGSIARAAKSAVKKEPQASAGKGPGRNTKPAGEKSPAKKPAAAEVKKSPAKKDRPAAERETAVNTAAAAAVVTPEDGEKIISRMICDLPIYLL